MVGHKINIKNYKMDRQSGEKEYEVKRALGNIILSPVQRHKGFKFYTNSKIVDKINDCKNNSIILDNTDYEAVKECFDTFQDYSRFDAELVRRIYEAEEVEMKENAEG